MTKLRAARAAISGALLLGLGFLVGSVSVANAQLQYPPQPFNQSQPYYQPPPYTQPQPAYRAPVYRPAAPAAPLSNYDPYTDGTVPAPNANGGP